MTYFLWLKRNPLLPHHAKHVSNLNLTAQSSPKYCLPSRQGRHCGVCPSTANRKDKDEDDYSQVTWYDISEMSDALWMTATLTH